MKKYIIVSTLMLSLLTGAVKSVNFIEYKVKGGDTVSTIAVEHNCRSKDIRELNNMGDSSLIRVGQILKIPLSSKVKKNNKTENISKKNPVSAPKTYKVEAGDSLSYIAVKFHTTVKALKKINGLKDKELIKVGEELKIPSPNIQSSSVKRKSESKKIVKSKTGEYIVKSGDTLFSIARDYHLSLKSLMEANSIKATDIIHPGDKLKIPVTVTKNSKKKQPLKSKKSLPKSSKDIYYTVQHGDSLWLIAHKNKISLKELMSLNSLKKGTVLKSGDRLLIKKGVVVKTVKKSPEKPKKLPLYYTVKHGDNLWKIAQKNRVTISKIRELNKLGRHTVLRSGMKLLVGYKTVSTSPKREVVSKSPKTKSKNIASKKVKSSKRHIVSKRKRVKKSKNSALAILSGHSSGNSYNSSASSRLIRTAKRYLGHRYVWGAEGPNTFDCSGFTQYVMRKSRGINLPRVSRKQAYYGKYITYKNLRPGDLIFFDTSHSRRGYVNHVGIYIGNHKFIHASSARHRVVITRLDSPFYRSRFMWGRRVN